MENTPVYADESWDLWTRIKDAWVKQKKEGLEWNEFLMTLDIVDLETCNEFYDECGDVRTCDCSYGCVICLGRNG